MQKKSGLGDAWFVGICFIVGGLILAIVSIKILIPYHQKGQDLYDAYFEDIPKHSRVYGEAFAVLDYCAEEYSTNLGVRSYSLSDAIYCIIPVYKRDGEEYYIMLQVDEHKRSKYDNLIQATQDYLLGKTESIGCEPIHFSGLLDNASSELYGYAKAWFRDTGYYSTNAEIEKHLLPYCINTTTADMVALHFLPVLGVGMLLLGVFFTGVLVKDKFESKKLQMSTIIMKGREYPIHDFDGVDKLLRDGKRAAAVIELSKQVGITYDEAMEILDKWHLYYY